MIDLPTIVAQASQNADSASLLGPVLGGLINAGGMGIMSAALLWLHREALTAFRAELKESRETFAAQSKAEREQCSEQFEKVVETATKNHQTVTEALARIDRLLSQQDYKNNRGRT
jgi:hypothetical protein